MLFLVALLDRKFMDSCPVCIQYVFRFSSFVKYTSYRITYSILSSFQNTTPWKVWASLKNPNESGYHRVTLYFVISSLPISVVGKMFTTKSRRAVQIAFSPRVRESHSLKKLFEKIIFCIRFPILMTMICSKHHFTFYITNCVSTSNIVW